jgi:hypothetical protein
MAIKWPWQKENEQVALLRNLLADPDVAAQLLGTRESRLKSDEDLTSEAAKVLRYSNSSDYKVFAGKSWERLLLHMDAILNANSSQDRVSYHRGAINEVLYLLRLSHEAREVLDAQGDRGQSVSSQR